MRDKIAVPTSFYHALRVTLGLIYFYFGFLKFWPGISPAELLAGQTISALLMDLIDPTTSVLLLAILECSLGALFVLNICPKVAYFVFLGHMVGTFSPMWLLPQLTFNQHVFIPTLEGQYILKNLVFLVAVSAIYLPRLYPTVNWGCSFQLSKLVVDVKETVDPTQPEITTVEKLVHGEQP